MDMFKHLETGDTVWLADGTALKVLEVAKHDGEFCAEGVWWSMHDGHYLGDNAGIFKRFYVYRNKPTVTVPPLKVTKYLRLWRETELDQWIVDTDANYGTQIVLSEEEMLRDKDMKKGMVEVLFTYAPIEVEL